MSSNDGKKRVAMVVGVCAFAGALLYLVVGGIGTNLVYYLGPTEVLAKGPSAQGASIRLGGLVEKGSIVKGQGSNMSFTVTDGKKSVPVRCTSVPPQMFREGIGVVIEGTMAGDGVFESHRLMVSHGNEYRAPGDAESVTLKKQMDAKDGPAYPDKK